MQLTPVKMVDICQNLWPDLLEWVCNLESFVLFVCFQSLDGVTLPRHVQTLFFQWELQSALRRCDIAKRFTNLGSWLQCCRSNNHLYIVTLPPCLQPLILGEGFNQRLVGVALPKRLQSLMFGDCFKKSWLRWSEIAKRSTNLAKLRQYDLIRTCALSSPLDHTGAMLSAKAWTTGF